MSQYNKTVLTNAGLELAKRANAGQARFEITRTVTSADDWSNKTIQDIEAVTAIPNIMQQGTILDTEEVESNNSVIGVSLCFTNKDLSAGYQIKIIGVYAKEEGQDKDFLYAVTTAVAPEYMPNFSDGVLYRFNMQMYLVIGKAQAVNVVINDGASVTHRQFDKYKSEVTANLEKIENAHKEDMGHVVKSASINGGAEILPNESGKLELVVPDPDLSKYVSLKQLTETLKSKADITAIPDKTATEEGIKQAKELAQEANAKAQNALDNKADKTTVEENLATKANQSDLNQTNAEVAKKANKADTYTKSNIDDMQAKSYFRKQGMNADGDLVEIRGNATKQPNGGYAFDIWSSDWTASKVKEIINQVASLNSAWQVRTYPNAVNLNDLWTAWGISYLTNIGNTNTPSFIDDKRGTLFTFTFDDNGKWQIFAGCIGGLAYRSYLKDDGAWHKIADDTDISDLQSKITNAQNTATQANTNANGRLSLGGGNMTLRSTINWEGGSIDDRTGNLGGLNWSGGTDWAKIYGDQDGSDNLDLAIDLGDDGSNHVSFRKNGSETSAITSDGHYTGTVDWGHVNGRPQSQVDRVNIITPLFRQIQNSNNWNDIFGVGNPNNVLTSLRIDAGGSGALLNNFAAGIGFGGGDTKGVLSVAYGDHQARITGGNGTGPVWSEDIAWKSDVNDLRNQVQQLRENQFEVQTFTDANAAANWEAQRPGHRLAIIQS